MSIIFASNSCDKEVLADEALTLKKIPYSSNQLRINGYYFQEKDDNIFTIYFFYDDGTILYGGGSFPLNEIEDYESQFKSPEWISSVKASKIRWGVFQITDNKISFEKWYPSSGGPAPVYIRSGEILNDTTFLITKSIRSKTGEAKDLNEVYHFKEFSPKPDSTNNFVK